MIAGIKRKILQNRKLLTFLGTFSQIWFLLCFRKRVTGRGISLARNVILRGGIIIVKGANNKLTILANCRLRNLRIEIFGNNNTIEIGESVMVYEKGWLCIEGDNCMISIGRKTTIGSADIFCGESDTTILIGEDCMFSRDIGMNTSDFHSIIDISTGKRINPPKDIIVGNKIWVGNNAFISKGSKVGAGSVIASRAFLSGKEFHANTVIAGLPAKVIKENVTWIREKLPV